MPASRKRKPHPTTQLFKVPEEMREWSALIATEVATWPEVSTRKMFGMNSLYRDGEIFAAVADKRALGTAYSVIFKIKQPTVACRRKLEGDSRIRKSEAVGKQWYGFELASPDDIPGALEWFDEAYRAAAPKLKRRRKSA
jgi:hypothetical protein